MLRVGIHEGVILSKVEKNDKGTLVIGIKKPVEGTALDAFNSSSDDSAVSQEESNDYLIFPFDTAAFGGGQKDAATLGSEVKVLKDKLTHILLGYMPKAKIQWNVFKGLASIKTQADIDTNIIKQDTLDAVYANIVDQFIAMAKDAVKSGKKFRFKTVRQSKAKHYSAIPTSRFGYSGDKAFWEDMTVTPSRLKYSDYEEKNGLNDPSRVEATADVTQAAEAEVTLTDDVFNPTI